MGLFFGSSKDLSVELVAEKVREIERLNTIIHKLKENEYDNASITVDFKNIDIFSIERQPGIGSNDYPRTIIGYYLKDKDGAPYVKEWYFYCSLAAHEKLVADYNAFKENRDGSQDNSK